MCTIMIIENRYTVQTWLLKCIEKYNIKSDETIVCDSGSEALEYISERNVDIVITRLKSDGSFCNEFIKAIRKKLLFSIVLGYGSCLDFNCLSTAVNNGISQYLEDIFNEEKLEKLLKDSYEKYCTGKISLMQMAKVNEGKLKIAYSIKILNDWVDVFTRNAVEGNLKNVENNINILTKIVDNQMLYHSKSMMLELIIIINDRISKGDFRSDYMMLSSVECSKLLHVDNAEKLKRMLSNHMNDLAENIYLLSSADSQKSQLIIAATKFIKENYQIDISRDDVALQINLNPSYFSKIFKEQMKESFVSYLRRIRMEKAMSYLENTSDSIKDISKKVGYYDSNYFSRVFFKHTGFTPNEYRKGIVKLMA